MEEVEKDFTAITYRTQKAPLPVGAFWVRKNTRR